MVFGLIAVSLTILPFLDEILQSRVEVLGDWISSQVTTRVASGVRGTTLTRKITQAIEEGNTERFIAEHKEHFPEEAIEEIRTLARLRKLTQKSQRQIERKHFTEASGGVFMGLAAALEKFTQHLHTTLVEHFSIRRFCIRQSRILS